MINFYPNTENQQGVFLNYIYFHGYLNQLAENVGAFPPDLVYADGIICEEGIYPAIFHDGKGAQIRCLAFIYDCGSQGLKGLIASLNDPASLHEAFVAFTEKKTII